MRLKVRTASGSTYVLRDDTLTCYRPKGHHLGEEDTYHPATLASHVVLGQRVTFRLQDATLHTSAITEVSR